MAVLIGTSGWQYRHWRSRFYPADVAQAHWLEHYAARFATVEVNNAFYRLPESRTFEDWRDRTPEDFVLSVKASRYITHVKRLHEPAEPVKRLPERSGHLGAKLGPVLLQLPPNLPTSAPTSGPSRTCSQPSPKGCGWPWSHATNPGSRSTPPKCSPDTVPRSA